VPIGILYLHCTYTKNTLHIRKKFFPVIPYASSSPTSASTQHPPNPPNPSNPQTLSWENLGCAETPSARIQEAGPCGRGGTTAVIGWDLRRRVFLPEIELCFDKELETTLYTHHVVPGR